MQLVIKRVREQGRDIRSFDMLPAEANASHGLSFVPGQVAVLRLAEEKKSYFALASAPADPELEFLVKRQGVAAETLYGLGPGAEIELIEIVGRGYALDEHRGQDLVFIAMGTGVAPLRSALRATLPRRRDFGRLFVLYGVRTPEDFCYREEVEDWRAAGVDLRQVISRPDGYEWSGPTGYVQSLLDHVLPELAAPIALLCGSREMIEQTRERLRLMGLEDRQILTNY